MRERCLVQVCAVEQPLDQPASRGRAGGGLPASGIPAAAGRRMDLLGGLSPPLLRLLCCGAQEAVIMRDRLAAPLLRREQGASCTFP